MHYVLSLATCPIRWGHDLREHSAPRNIHDVSLASDEVHHSVSHCGTRELSDTDNVGRNRAPLSALDLSGCKHGGLGKYLERLRRIVLVHLHPIPNRQPVRIGLLPQFGRILRGTTSVHRNEPSPRLRAIRSNGQKDHQILMLSPVEVAGSEHSARSCETLT